MSWVTIIWSVIASVSLTLAIIYLLIWFRERRSWAHLCFFVLAVGVIGVAAGEFAAMYAKLPTEYGRAIRWGHFAYLFVLVGSLGFVHFYFGTGKRWLFGLALGLRLLAVVVNFTTGLNLHISAIQSLQQVNFLGEPVSMLGVWTPNPWMRLGQLAALAQLIYVVDASLRLWRTGVRESQRRAMILGGTLAFFILLASGEAGLVAAGVLRLPIVVSIPFLAVLLAMSYELSRDALRAAQLGRELRESEQQMALATEAANLGVWVRDLVRNEIWASDRWRVLFGFTLAERLNLDKFLQHLHPDDRESYRQAVAKATNGFGHYEAEFRVVLPDGRMRWIMSRGQVEFERGGKPVRVRGVSADITERKRAEEASRNEHELIAAVFNSVPGLLYLYTEDGRLVRWNRQHEQITGYTAEELLNFRIQDWFAEEDQVKLANEFSKVLSEGHTLVEMNLKLKNGQMVPHSFTGTKVIIAGRPHLVGIGINISARKKAEELLRESEERMTLAAEAAGFGVWIWNFLGNRVWGSERWLRLFGFAPDAAISFEMVIQRIHPDDGERVVREVRRAVANCADYAGEYRVVLPDGTQRWIGAQGRMHSDAHGRPDRMMGAAIDITDRKQAEAEAMRQRAELAHVARVSTMGELAASVAHELNQPLGAILANAEAAEMFLNQNPPALDELRDILTDIRKDDERASEVIRRMRALLRKHELERQPLEINSVVEDVLQVVSGDAALRKMAISADLSLGLPRILGDRVHLQQVLLNLMLNGMDAMAGEARGRRRLSLRTRLNTDGLVEIAVMDSGHGIAPDMLPRLFEPFHTTKPNGMGMGLSISRTIIAAHHGRITAENNSTGGATFRVTLPVIGKGQGTSEK